MQENILTNRLSNIYYLKEICTLAKELKDQLIYVDYNYIYSSDLECYIYKSIYDQNIINNYPFIFSTNQLKSTSCKLLLHSDQSNFIIVNESIITTSDFLAYIMSDEYIVDNSSQDVLVLNDNKEYAPIPALKINRADQFSSYHNVFINRLYSMKNNILCFNEYYQNSDSFASFRLDTHPAFIDMIEKKKAYGKFMASFKDEDYDMYYVVTFFKGMIPYKKGVTVDLVVKRIERSSRDFYAMYVVNRKNKQPIKVYCHYLNLFYKE